MKIKLLDHTPIKPLVEACIMPYQSEGDERLVKRVFDSGHRSIARHGMASFIVTGVSQSLLRQLSRHPHANLTVKSARYCGMEEEILKGVIPPFARGEDKENLMEFYKYAYKVYSQLAEDEHYSQEEKNEIKKLVLPLGSTTDLIISGNYQAFYEWLQLRNCVRAEWEIRELARVISRDLETVMPIIFGDLDCKAQDCGICVEHEGCGKYPKK